MDFSSSNPLLYIAGTGCVTSIGPNAETTFAIARTGHSAYRLSNYDQPCGEPITLACVPDELFDTITADLEEGDRFNARHDRMLKMAIYAIRAACESLAHTAVPMILGLPENQGGTQGLSSFLNNLQHNCQPWIQQGLCRSIYSGRTVGLEALDFVFSYLYGQNHDYLLVGGVDSPEDEEILMPLAAQGRLLGGPNADGFVPGEAACFLLLTKHKALAEARNGQVIALHVPSIAEEPGHLYSSQPYLGEGLDKAFKRALHNQPTQSISTIYSSMNGEHHWAKEYGVAYLRNKAHFKENTRLEHPADCYGDLGAACATTLICMAAEDLHRQKNDSRIMVYSSADRAPRAALIVEKIPA